MSEVPLCTKNGRVYVLDINNIFPSKRQVPPTVSLACFFWGGAEFFNPSRGTNDVSVGLFAAL